MSQGFASHYRVVIRPADLAPKGLVTAAVQLMLLLALSVVLARMLL